MRETKITRPHLSQELPRFLEDDAADDEFTAGEFSGLEDPEYNNERAQEALRQLKGKDPDKWKPLPGPQTSSPLINLFRAFSVGGREGSSWLFLN
jgi:hypothetical protein